MIQYKERIQELSDKLHKHNYRYYTLNEPIVSDYDYDQMLKELERLEKDFPEFITNTSPTKRITGEVINSFKQIKHKQPMLSLSNTYSKEEVKAFVERTNVKEYVCELKHDGVAVSLHYKNNQLVHAVTRGDGETGEDITNNVKAIKSIPIELYGSEYPIEFEIRGEVVMPHASFKMLNDIKVSNGDKPFANPRNAAAGSLKQLDSAETSRRELDCYFYSIHGDHLEYDNHYDNLVNCGFKISKHVALCEGTKDIIEFIEFWDLERHKLNYDIDGIVIKVNDYYEQEDLGYSSKYPKWACAYKYQAEQASTKLLSVEFQVGRTGAITPVANLEPILLAGSTIRRASMHNEDIMKALVIKENDYVFIEKAGEIIPQIVKVDLSKRKKNAKLIVYPTHCPACDTELIHKIGEVAIYCPNHDQCPPQVLAKYIHFVSKGAMNIKHLGESKLELLLYNGMLDDVSDLYNLTYDEIIGLEGANITLQDRSAMIMLSGIEESKSQPAWRLLYGLGIKNVGSTVSKQLVKHFNDIEMLLYVSHDELIALDDIGDTIANSIIDWFKSPENHILLQKFYGYGLNMEQAKEVINENKNNMLQGKNILVSGTFNISRNDLKQLISDNGGVNQSSLSTKTDYLIVGEKMGPAKKVKAEKLGTKMISEKEFKNMIK